MAEAAAGDQRALEGLWREQAQAVIKAMPSEAKLQNAQGMGAQVSMLLYGAVAVEWAAVQQAMPHAQEAAEKKYRLGARAGAAA